MAGGSKVKGRKGKLGKKKHWIAAYYMSGRYYKNKARKLRTHFAAHPADTCAFDKLKELGGALGKTFDGKLAPKKPNTKPGYLAWRAGDAGFKRGGVPHQRIAMSMRVA